MSAVVASNAVRSDRRDTKKQKEDGADNRQLGDAADSLNLVDVFSICR